MLNQEQFIRRFKTELRNLLEDDYDDDHAADMAKDYWTNPVWPEGTPEGCARFEASEYGEA